MVKHSGSTTARTVFLLACLAGFVVLPATNWRSGTVAQSNVTIQQVDVGNNESPANFGAETSIAMSANGRVVAFVSFANNLVSENQPFNFQDIFIRDHVSGTTEIVSVNSSGLQSDGISIDPAMSADGRFVVFTSDATNLVPGDTNQCFYNLLDESSRPGDCPDIFLHDRETGVTERISVSSGGAQANDQSFVPAISADGRFVTFMSMASNFFPKDVPVSVDLFIHDRQTSKTERVLSPAVLGDYTITPDARYIAYLGINNGYYAVFVYDRQTGTNELASVPLPGKKLNGYSSSPAISADGRFVAFSSSATTLVVGDTNGRRDVFVRDRVTGTTERVSVGNTGVQANGDSFPPYFPGMVAISADGKLVTFSSSATNLVPGDTNTCAVQYAYSFLTPGQCPDIFVRDREAGTTERVSVNGAGGQANGASFRPVMSADGKVLAFLSLATNLVSAGTNSCGNNFPFRLNQCEHIFARVKP